MKVCWADARGCDRPFTCSSAVILLLVSGMVSDGSCVVFSGEDVARSDGVERGVVGGVALLEECRNFA